MADSKLDDVELTLVESWDEAQRFMSWLGERRPILGVDIETSGLSLAKDRIRTVQFGDAMHGWAVPYETRPRESYGWPGLISHVLKVYEGPIVLQHAKFDAGFLLRDGIPFPWERTHDTMFMLFLNDSLGPKSLKPGAVLHVDSLARAGEAELKRLMHKNRWGYGDVPIRLPAYWGYAAMDTVLTARLAEALWPLVQPYRAAYDLELACERVLCEMELRGMQIDVEYCVAKRDELEQRLASIGERLGDLNPAAPLQVSSALLAAGVQLTKRTEKGQLSVDDEVLSALAPQHPIARDVLEFRYASKMMATYFENFLTYHDGGILHPHVKQLAARTGRMSVTEPALQTVPKTPLVRDAFVPRDEGRRLVLCDYDNEELRVAAHFSEDEAMLRAFEEGRDLHGESAARIFGAEWTPEQRKIGKAAMFAKAYGAGPTKFALTTGLPPAEAARMFRLIDQTFPGMARAMQQVTAKVRERAGDAEHGWVQLIDGRRLKVPADKPYMGFNYLIQGSCAVVLKQSLVDLDLAGLGDFLVLPVHDEIVFDVPLEDLPEAVPEIVRTMRRDDFRAPLTVGHKIVERWGDPYREAA